MVYDISIDSFEHFSLSVGSSATQLTSTAYTCRKGATIKAASDNSESVYIGKSDVTDGDASATDGYELTAGDEIFIGVSDPTLIYAISTSGSQKVYVLLE